MSCNHDGLCRAAFITAEASLLKGKATLNHAGRNCSWLILRLWHIAMSVGCDMTNDIFSSEKATAAAPVF